MKLSNSETRSYILTETTPVPVPMLWLHYYAKSTLYQKYITMPRVQQASTSVIDYAFSNYF